jgi:hypothetical protein
MVDPTIGSLVATALAMAAEATLKGAVGEGVKDAYKALKEKVSHRASADVELLETTPSSASRQAVISEIINAQPKDDQELLRSLAKTLIARLRDGAPAIGLDIGRLDAVQTELGNIRVTKGIGVVIEEAHGGTIKTGDITVDP